VPNLNTKGSSSAESAAAIHPKAETNFHGISPGAIPREKDVAMNILLALLGCLILGAAGQPQTKGSDELPELRGEWWLVSTADKKRADRGSEECRMVIDGKGTVVFWLGRVTTNRGTVTVSRSGKLRLIDMQLSTGTVLGVYEQQGNDLVICCDWREKGRPAGMTPKGSQWVETWRRVAASKDCKDGTEQGSR
jgi:hypothetical protein